ncbi:uncharacterized protein JCM6883_001292 [Sporobolomyces salmoneus]|uniref:uncharacterized protein n=1 Tax=Sporobolomyces salmoneus TaxID=183962 RepID=UPI0031700AF4
MDSLPRQLLKLISDSVEEDPQPRLRQTALAALARTNKTFYTICNPRLYFHPILLNEKRATEWAQKYTRRVDPWKISRGTRELKDVFVPKSMTFSYRKDRKRKTVTGPRPIFSRLPAPVDGSSMVKLGLSSYFFRNLTSFTLRTPVPFSSTSSDLPYDQQFVISLFGPLGINRAKIRRLVIQGTGNKRIVPFLLEADKRFPWEIYVDDIPRLNTVVNEEDIEWLALCEEEDQDPFDDSRYASYEDLEPQDLLEAIYDTRRVSCRPFTSLKTLVLAIDRTFELYLILISRLFPSLKRLVLIGKIQASDNAQHDVRLLRHSIAKRKGSFVPPGNAASLAAASPDIFNSWNRLAKAELESEPKFKYVGPHLSKLDLSELEIELA